MQLSVVCRRTLSVHSVYKDSDVLPQPPVSVLFPPSGHQAVPSQRFCFCFTDTRISVVFSCCCSVAQSRPALCNCVACSLPGSSVPGVSQARSLEWAAVAFFSRGSFGPAFKGQHVVFVFLFLTSFV